MGNAKEEGKEQTPTPTHLAHTGQTLKHQGKRKSGWTTDQTQTREGGADGSLTQPTRPGPNHPQHIKGPNLTHGSTHEIRELTNDAPSFQRTVRDKAQRRGLSMHPDELSAQHSTLTKRKWPHPDSMSWSLKPCHVASAKGWAVSRAKLEKEVSQVQQSATLAISQVKGVEARYCGILWSVVPPINRPRCETPRKSFHTSQSALPPSQQSNTEKGQLLHFT